MTEGHYSATAHITGIAATAGSGPFIMGYPGTLVLSASGDTLTLTGVATFNDGTAHTWSFQSD